MRRWHLLPICLVLALALPAQADTPLGYVPYSSDYRLFQVEYSGDTSFSAKINGTPSGATVTYDTVTGNEDSIVPYATTLLGKLVLRNTTRGTSAKISSVNTSTNTIAVTDAADIVGWADNDDITCNSAVCTDPGISHFFDLDLSGFLPATAAVVELEVAMWDTAANAYVMLHPYDAYVVGKTFVVQNVTASGWFRTVTVRRPVVDRKICLYVNASGTGTARYYLTISGWFERMDSSTPTLRPSIITGTLSSGSPYQVERSFTYGQISVALLAGTLLALALLVFVWRVINRGK